MVVRNVYKNGNRYDNKEQLRGAVLNAFTSKSLDYIRTIYHSMPRGFLSVSQRKGVRTNY